jgi:hypothetical protein
MSSDVTDNGVTCSHCSDHESRVSSTSTRLALALCTLIEHVTQDIVVAIFVHVVDSHMPIASQSLCDASKFGFSRRVGDIPL